MDHVERILNILISTLLQTVIAPGVAARRSAPADATAPTGAWTRTREATATDAESQSRLTWRARTAETRAAAASRNAAWRWSRADRRWVWWHVSFHACSTAANLLLYECLR